MNIEMRKRRQAAGLTLEELAKRVGLAYPTVQALESGRGRGFSVASKRKIADALGADVLELFPELRVTPDFISGPGYKSARTAKRNIGKVTK
jgi:transcriptional regulator with XRE-family HTH domain